MKMIAELRSCCSSAQQAQHLGLGRHVDGGGRLVGDEQSGVAGERHGDDGALAQTAAELPRVCVQALLGHRDADVPQQVVGEIAGRLLADRLVQHDRFDDLVPDGVDRAEGRHRLLRDQRDLAAADRAHLLAAADPVRPGQRPPRRPSRPGGAGAAGSRRRRSCRAARRCGGWTSWSRSCRSRFRPRCRTIWPASTSKLTPSTALTTPSSSRKWVLRSRTDSSGSEWLMALARPWTWTMDITCRHAARSDGPSSVVMVRLSACRDRRRRADRRRRG